MKILWQSAAPFVSSGYGIQTALLVPRLRAAGHAVTVFAHAGLAHGSVILDGSPILPPSADPYGNDIVLDHYRAAGVDLLITVADVWVFKKYGLRGMRWCPWTPIDHKPAPPPVVGALAGAYDVLAFSKFAGAELRRAGVDSCYIPLGVDTQTFKPAASTAAVRRRLGIDEECFLIGLVGVNNHFPCRKGQDRALEAFADFNRRHPDSVLYLHTAAGSRAGGIDLAAYARILGLGDATRFVDQYRYHVGISRSEMAALYGAFDVLVAPSTGEGFGLPIVEAQACGVPVIVTDFTSMPELCGAGWKVGPSDHFITPLLAYQALASVAGLVNALEQAWQRRGDAELREAAAQFGRRFDVDRIFSERWQPWLDAIEERIASEREPSAAGDFRRLQLGCGLRPFEGYVNHDRSKHSAHVDLAWDLAERPWPWPDGDFVEVAAFDVLEHLADVVGFMDECWRVLARRGRLRLSVPAAGSWEMATDPTHEASREEWRRGFTENSLDYFDPRTELGTAYGYYSDRKWHIERCIRDGALIYFELSPRKGSHGRVLRGQKENGGGGLASNAGTASGRPLVAADHHSGLPDAGPQGGRVPARGLYGKAAGTTAQARHVEAESERGGVVA